MAFFTIFSHCCVVENALVEILIQTKENLNAININGKYAYAYFIREQRFLLEILEGVPGAFNIPGVYFSPFIESGYKNGYPSYKVILIKDTIQRTVNAIDKILAELYLEIAISENEFALSE